MPGPGFKKFRVVSIHWFTSTKPNFEALIFQGALCVLTLRVSLFKCARSDVTVLTYRGCVLIKLTKMKGFALVICIHSTLF